jgi:catechol 2,3-dioxygenase
MSERLLSQLAHVEVFSPVVDESVAWYTQVLGLEETAREGQSVYLRAWGEDFHSSLIVTEGPTAGLGHIGWRTAGPDDVETIARRLDGEWVDESVGHGRAYRYRGPGGQTHEVFWDVERWQAPPELAGDFPGRPQRYTGRGVAVRYLDHVTVGTPDVLAEGRWQAENLGMTFTDYIVLKGVHNGNDFVVFGTATNHHTHELGFVPDPTGVPGRVNHVAFWLDQRADVERAANVLLGSDNRIEFGPGVHGIDEITYLYVREPSGLRIELNSGGRRLLQPDWQTREWTPEQGATSFYRNIGMPESMMESFPSPEAAATLDKDLYTPGARS